MSKKFRITWVIFCFILVYWIYGLSKHMKGGYIDLGHIILTDTYLQTDLIITLHKSSQSWRFRFDADLSEFEKGSAAEKDMVTIGIENISKMPIQFLLPGGNETITIDPSDSREIFSGSVKEMLMLGRTSRTEVSVDLMKQKKVKLKLHFKPKISKEKKYDIHIIAYHYVEMF
jgi:hypothetical protein